MIFADFGSLVGECLYYNLIFWSLVVWWCRRKWRKATEDQKEKAKAVGSVALHAFLNRMRR